MKKHILGIVLFAGLSAFAYNSGSYVHDGLIAQWDGIDNAIVGGVRCHDATATDWADLSGNGHTMKGVDVVGNFGDMAFEKTKGVAKAMNLGLNPATFEVVLDLSQVAAGQWIVPLSTTEKFYPTFLRVAGNPNTLTIFYGYSQYGYTGLPFPENGLLAVSCSTDGTIWLNGAPPPEGSTVKTDYWGKNDNNVLGGSSVGHGNNGTKNFAIRSIRFYDHVLSEVERTANARVDGARFLGLTGADSLIVTGVPDEYGTPSPEYGIAEGHVVGETYTCTCSPTWTNGAQNSSARCAGYRLDVGGAVFQSGTFDPGEECAFDYVHPDNESGVNLVWLFETQNKIETSADIDGVTVTSSHLWAKTGETVTLTATFEDETHSCFSWDGVDGTMSGNTFTFVMPNLPVTVALRTSTTLYVTVDGDDARAGTTRETSLGTLSAAVAKALELGTPVSVLVGPGEYEQPAKLSIASANPIRLASEEGPERTFVVRTAAYNYIVEVNGADVTVDGFTFMQREAAKNGSVLDIQKGTVSHCVVSNTWFTKGINLATGGLMVDSLVCGNHQSGRDAVVSMIGGTLERCQIVRNLTNNDTYGEGVEFWANGTMRNCLVADNTNASTHCSGVFARTATLIESCTIANNVTMGASGPAGVDGTTGTFRNCIIIGNRNLSGVSETVARTYEHCASSAELTGVGNVRVSSVDFADAAAGDYRVMSGLTIDAAKAQPWMKNGVDLAGNPRIYGEEPDMGCYEFVPGGLRASVLVSANDVFSGEGVTLSSSVSGADLDGLSYAWTVTRGGVTVATGDAATLVLDDLASGRYDVALTVRNGAGDEYVWTEGESLVKAHPQTVYVSKTSTPLYPYETWETAAADLPTALDEAIDGMTVLIGEGVYTNDACSTIGHAITVRAVAGRDRTTFVRRQKDLVLLKLADKNASFSGVTFSQATPRSADEGGQVVNVSGGLFADCAIVECYQNSGVYDLVQVSGCTVSNVIVRGNYTEGRVGNFGVYDGALVENCTFVANDTHNNTYCAAVYLPSGTLRNCLIYCNTNDNNAAGVTYRGGLIENCTIVSNVITGSKYVRAAGIDHENPQPLEIRNSIVRWNWTPNGESNISSKIGWTDGGGEHRINVHHTLTEPVFPEGEGNLGGDPKFASPSSIRGLRLLPSSPAVNAGLNQPWMEGAVDLFGNPRINRKDGIGIVDLGCYERVPSGLMLIAR